MHYLFTVDGKPDRTSIMLVASTMATRGRLAWQCDGRGSYLSRESALTKALIIVWAEVNAELQTKRMKHERRPLPRGFAYRPPKPRAQPERTIKPRKDTILGHEQPVSY